MWYGRISNWISLPYCQAQPKLKQSFQAATLIRKVYFSVYQLTLQDHIAEIEENLIFFYKWKVTLIYVDGRWPQILKQGVEDDLKFLAGQSQLELSLAHRSPSLFS